MQKQQKVDTVAELKDTFARAASLVLADYRGLKVSQVNELRSEIRSNACSYRVIKNTLAKRAIAGTAMEGLAAHFTGPTAVAYSFEDPVAPAKILDKFAKDLEKLDVKAAYVDGKVLDGKGVKQLAQMKGKDELRAELLMTLMAPTQNFVALTNAVATNFVYVLKARENALGGE